MSNRPAKWVLALISAAILLLAGAAWSQEYPTRLIRFIVPVPAGTTPDLLARQVASKLKERLGWNTVIENKAGADFAPGILATTQAPADGYTILQGYMSFAILPHMRKNLSWDLRDLTPVARIATSPSMIGVNSNVPANTLAELVAYSKGNPGKLSFGGSAIGTTGHLSAEMIRRMTGLDFVYVPYRDAGGGTTDLMAGRLQIGYNVVADYIEHVKTGKIRPILVLGPTRHPMLPDVPAAVELTGNQDLDIASWYGFFVRTGTPSAIIARIEREIVALAEGNEMRDWITKVGLQPLAVMETSEPFRKRIEADSRRWLRVIQEAKLQPE